MECPHCGFHLLEYRSRCVKCKRPLPRISPSERESLYRYGEDSMSIGAAGMADAIAPRPVAPPPESRGETRPHAKPPARNAPRPVEAEEMSEASFSIPEPRKERAETTAAGIEEPADRSSSRIDTQAGASQEETYPSFAEELADTKAEQAGDETGRETGDELQAAATGPCPGPDEAAACGTDEVEDQPPLEETSPRFEDDETTDLLPDEDSGFRAEASDCTSGLDEVEKALRAEDAGEAEEHAFGSRREEPPPSAPRQGPGRNAAEGTGEMSAWPDTGEESFSHMERVEGRQVELGAGGGEPDKASNERRVPSTLRFESFPAGEEPADREDRDISRIEIRGSASDESGSGPRLPFESDEYAVSADYQAADPGPPPPSRDWSGLWLALHRAAAGLFDLAVWALMCLTLFKGAMMAGGGVALRLSAPEWAALFGLPLFMMAVILALTYGGLFGHVIGRTPGMMIFGLKLESVKGGRPALSQAAAYSLVFIVSMVPAILNLLPGLRAGAQFMENLAGVRIERA